VRMKFCMLCFNTHFRTQAAGITAWEARAGRFALPSTGASAHDASLASNVAAALTTQRSAAGGGWCPHAARSARRKAVATFPVTTSASATLVERALQQQHPRQLPPARRVHER
jgi:hypothetical protein